MTGLFVTVEGGEGAGKSTQVARLADVLRAEGRDVVVTREPGATALGARLRELLLDPHGEHPGDRAEALLYAADRAEHVARVIRPALDRGAVVVSDRYVDSSLAYQAGGRDLAVAEIEALSRFATGGLVPDRTVLIDIDPRIGLDRAGRTSAPDRLESERIGFHDRVRERFRELAAAGGDRYLVVDGTMDPDGIHAAIRGFVLGESA